MRIQHNISAMNAYRNYTNNNSTLSKNLEKLSSGYKINRAGDDAAGLAISEKMRAQIAGLDQAQANAKSGVNLVQTAEGALTEVHDMLNRMTTLADQSANGTYDNTTDRANLQKEVKQLKDEIDRIADASNFNGINLLDGSLSGKSQVDNLTLTTVDATKSKYTGGALLGTAADLTGETVGKSSFEYTVSWTDASGASKTTNVKFTYNGKGDVTTHATNKDSNYYETENGIQLKLDTNGQLTATNLGDAVEKALKSDADFANTFDITRNADTLTFEAKVAGANKGTINAIGNKDNTTAGSQFATTATTNTQTTKGEDAKQKFDVTTINAASTGESAETIASKVFEVDGHKFLLNKNDALLTQAERTKLGDDVTIIEVAGTAGAAGEASKIAGEITRITGQGTSVNGKDITFEDGLLKTSGNDLTLQIGDTSDSFNQLSVKIQDMHASSLGIGDVDISTQEKAASAVQKIKDAINNVSSVRGTLGATQNRLEHTMNNLSVMSENITDAESNIRDTDVAAEMMKYTKNNILIQSAQAMLAQANQTPQGVLQLLQ